MSMLDLLTDPVLWQEFYNYKEADGHMSKRDLASLRTWITHRGYLPVAERIMVGSPFPHPCRKEQAGFGQETGGLHLP